MNRELDSVLYEAVINSIDYSDLRRSNKKWETSQMTISAVLEKFRSPNKIIIQIIRDTNGRSAIVLQRKRGESTYILLSEFINRIKIKRNKDVFNLIYAIWISINPNHVKILKRSLYTQVLTCLARSIYPSVSSRDLERDIDLDFGSTKGIVFSQFYDSVFEMIDNGVNSFELAQYLQVIHRMQQSVFNAPWFKTCHPSFKVIKDSRPTYHSWMLPYFTQGKFQNFAEELSMTLI
jgi:hypothetical protein